ncbi:MAG: GNAT family N-acetyltransferase [Proteobacteria bacterium]|nr:GNAT family N-acetyltransferase [Pseudomonadota bacterium]
MIRFRRITSASTPANRAAIEESQAIIRAQFPGLSPDDIDQLPARLHDPLRFRFLSVLIVAEDGQEHVRACALILFAPDDHYALLDIISAEPGGPGRGLGGALYERVRDEAEALGAVGLFCECLPDDPALSPDETVRKQNIKRLRFYERFGVRPIMGTKYETPLSPDDTDPPYLMFDGLGKHSPPDAGALRRVVRSILERKYGGLCSPEYVENVVGSIRKDGFSLREPKYILEAADQGLPIRRLAGGIPLVVNDRHLDHHVHDRGYVETPVRIRSILAELDKTELFETTAPKHFPDRFIREVHDSKLVDYIERACRSVPENKSIYPYVFPIRNQSRPPKEAAVRAGYYCIDTFTPLNENAYLAARRCVDCALTAAEAVRNGAHAAYALVRPPGHHAERDVFGGFCYFNNAAIAANYLTRYGRVALLDIDYHHGNGAQNIFYERADVLTVSIHGHPRFAYPYFTGFREESGLGEGAGYNLNLPLPETITPAQYRDTLQTALRRITRFAPDFLIVAVGFDTANGDPTGTWPHKAGDFETIGRMLGETALPILVVQEGGYKIRTLGTNARRFFTGLAEGLDNPKPAPRVAPRGTSSDILTWRDQVRSDDIEAVRSLVSGTGNFSTDEIDIAAELVRERVKHGRASGYEFVLVSSNDRLVGYACFGPIPGTEDRFDLYWIAVRADQQNQGLGKKILDRAESAMRRLGAGRIYIDTSSTAKYAATHKFYRRNGYRVAAKLPDFYRANDGKIIFAKTMPPEN